MRYDIAYKDYGHIFLGVRESVFTCTEEIKYRVDEYECQDHEHQTYDDVKADYIAEDLVCCLVVLLT